MFLLKLGLADSGSLLLAEFSRRGSSIVLVGKSLHKLVHLSLRQKCQIRRATSIVLDLQKLRRSGSLRGIARNFDGMNLLSLDNLAVINFNRSLVLKAIE